MKRMLKEVITVAFIVGLSFHVNGQNKAIKQDSICIIVNSKNPVKTMTLDEVRIHWLREGKIKWSQEGFKKSIKPVDFTPPNSIRNFFYKAVLNEKKQGEIRNYLLGQAEDKKIKYPDTYKTEADILGFVSEEEGGIGYLRKSYLDLRSQNKNLKDITIVLTIPFNP